MSYKYVTYLILFYSDIVYSLNVKILLFKVKIKAYS